MNQSRRASRHLSRTAVASVAVVAVLVTLAACGGSKSNASASASATPTISVPSPTAAPTSPFTGLPMKGDGGDVIAIKIDNTQSALPHIGLTSADVVYIEQVEGGLTRIAAVYASKLPPVVAPIRSARETDAELFPMYGSIPLAFSGSVASVHALIKKAGLVDVSQDVGGVGYYRLSSRYAPYNLAGVPATLLTRVPVKVHPRNIGFVFGPLPAGGRPVTSVTEVFPSAIISFTYVPKSKRWVYRLNGQVDQVPGKPAASASNVVIQYVSIGNLARFDKVHNPVPFTRSIGTGQALVLRDGRAFSVTWSRPTVSSPTTYTYEGAPFPMQAGQQWVVFANRLTPARVK